VRGLRRAGGDGAVCQQLAELADAKLIAAPGPAADGSMLVALSGGKHVFDVQTSTSFRPSAIHDDAQSSKLPLIMSVVTAVSRALQELTVFCIFVRLCNLM
jgi:hypothetical protein